MSRIKELSKEELEYRKKIKEAAQKEFENFKANCPYDDFDDVISPRVSATAQLCIAANLVTLTESVEKLTEELAKSNDHGLSETKESIYEDNMYLLDDDN